MKLDADPEANVRPPRNAEADVPPKPARAGRQREGVINSRWLPIVTTPFIVALVIVVWKIYVETQEISRFVLPPPEEVGSAFLDQIRQGHVWRLHIWTTFYETMFGFGVGLVVGVTLGFIMGKSRLVQTIANPFVVATQVVPKVALVPLFILWFGFGPTSKVAISAMLAFFPILNNTAFGVRSVPRGMQEMMQSLGATRWHRFRKLDLPHTAAYILTGAEVGVVLATIGAIVGEYLGGDRGLGRYTVNLQNTLQIPELYGAILIMSIFGFVLYIAVAGLRRLLIPWHESVGRWDA